MTRRSIVVVVESEWLTPSRVDDVKTRTKSPNFIELEGANQASFPAFWRRQTKPRFLYSTKALRELAEGNDKGPVYWSLRESDAVRLGDTVSLLDSKITTSFELYVTPFGEDPQYEEIVTGTELRSRCQSGLLRSDTLYIVEAN